MPRPPGEDLPGRQVVVWLDPSAAASQPALAFLRGTQSDGGQVVQGFVLDWPQLRDRLLLEIHDLFPDARLELEHAGAREQHVLEVEHPLLVLRGRREVLEGVQGVEYGEIIATVSSRSAGPGTRKNIDEFTRTTAKGVEVVGGAERGKSIIIINPADPPLIMRDTIHCLTVDAPKEQEIIDSAQQMIAEVQKYVPGYTLKNGPVFDGNRVSFFMEVEGLGDFLPKYAGNLDIITSAAVAAGEVIAGGRA